MAAHTNETKQHFETRKLDEDMKDAHAEIFKAHPREHVRRLQAENKGILVLLAVIVVIVVVGGRLLGAF